MSKLTRSAKDHDMLKLWFKERVSYIFQAETASWGNSQQIGKFEKSRDGGEAILQVSSRMVSKTSKSRIWLNHRDACVLLTEVRSFSEKISGRWGCRSPAGVMVTCAGC